MKFFGKGPKEPIDFSKIAPPWDSGRTSIYRHILANIDPEDGKLTEAGRTLPDDDVVYKPGDLRWVPGGFDGTFGHHGGGGADEATATKHFKHLKKLLKSPSSDSVAVFYEHLLEEKTLGFIDPFLEFIVREELVQDPSLYSLTKWLIKNSPDREAVKTAIAMLGTCATEDDSDLFIEIGKHEEFTLYAIVAITHSLSDPEDSLWYLGKAVDGWGRIHVIETLSTTKNQEIQDWMLHEGYKNTVMYEYTAYTCATTGRLMQALCDPNLSEQLVDAACTIMQHMNNPGPRLANYQEAPMVLSKLAEILQNRELSLSQLIAVSTIQENLGYLADEHGAAWKREKEKFERFYNQVLSRDVWTEKIDVALASDDDAKFAEGGEAARVLKIDIWEHYYQRVLKGKDDWYYLMQTTDRDRIERAISLAEKLIPLDQIATGPSNSLGLGPEYKHHSDLDWLLSALSNWPGCGHKLIDTGLKSPVVRNRNMSLQALKQWGRNHWHAETDSVLNQMLLLEPNAQTRKLIGEVLTKDGSPNGT